MNNILKQLDSLTNDELWQVVEHAQQRLKIFNSKPNRQLMSTQPEVNTQDAFIDTKNEITSITNPVDSLGELNDESFVVLETKFLKVEDMQKNTQPKGTKQMNDLKRKLMEIDNLINAPKSKVKKENNKVAKNGMTLKTELYNETQQNSNIKKETKLPPFKQFDPGLKVDEKDENEAFEAVMVDELLEDGCDLPTELSKENQRRKNLTTYLNNYKGVKDCKRLTLNYNPIRMMPWRIQDFKLNENSEYGKEKETKKTKKYWEDRKKWGKYKSNSKDEFNDKYYENFYLFFDNMKNVENPLRSVDRISYPSTLEMKQDKYYWSVFEYNECKKMLLLALDGSVPTEDRGYIFRDDLLNQLVDSGMMALDFDTLMISYMKYVKEYE